MRILGVIIGLIIGGLFESLGAALILGFIGAFALPALVGSKKDSSVVTNDAPIADSDNPTPATLPAYQPKPDLHARVAELEDRVAQLELQVQRGDKPVTARQAAPIAAASATAVAASVPAKPETTLEAPSAATLPAQAAPGALVQTDLPPTTPSLPPSSLERPATPPMAAAQASAGEQQTPPHSATPITPVASVQSRPPSAPATPPAPAVPLRERLPAPIAALIFGGNMLVKMGVLILFLGLAFLLRYTAERVTVPLELRYASVALVGAALQAFGWLLRNKRRDYALVLQGAGIGVFYLTTLAAMKLHPLIPPTVGFVFLFAVALLSALLAVVQRAPVLAIVAALEGFAAPVLASTGTNNPVGLFSYLLVLDVGIFAVAWFQAWRVLNVIGAVGTFTLAVGWAQRYYTDGQFGVVQPFLIVFFALFTLVGLLFARRTLHAQDPDDDLPLPTRALNTVRRVGRVDSALVFGVPMAAYGLQYMMVRHWEFGPAFAALGFGLFFLLLGRFVFATQAKGLRLLAEAYAIVGVIFGTLAIPLALEGQWTGAAWAIEAAGMYWLGVRQSRPYARAFAFVVLAGSVFKLLQATSLDGAPGHALLVGSAIGPLLVAAGALAMWALHRRAKLHEPQGWESLCGSALPWLGLAALDLIAWQTLVPMWAAVATAGLASVTFAWAMRKRVQALTPVTYGLQALAVASFIATLHRFDSTNTLNTTGQALASGWEGALAAGLLALSVLGNVGYNMLLTRKQTVLNGSLPQWSLGHQLAAVVGVGLLHLAMLFQVSLEQAALLWPLTACAVLWVALRLAHPALALLALGLQAVSAFIFVGHQAFSGSADAGHLSAFGHLGFWTPVVMGLTTLLCGAWAHRQVQRVPWCKPTVVLWLPVVWGLLWWMRGMVAETSRVLAQHGQLGTFAAAFVGIVLLTSAVALWVAQRRQWPQLGQATLATLAGLVVASLVGIDYAASTAGSGPLQAYVPSSGWGWLAWPLAALWHLVLLKSLRTWFGQRLLAWMHTVGLWFFVALAARQCQWLLADTALGASSSGTASSWALLGWVLVPALVLWALQARAVVQRWPVRAYAQAYIVRGALPVALYLLLWVWVTNATSPGNASPLPYLPLLNPLELAHWLVLAALVLWWRSLGAGTAPHLTQALPPLVTKAALGLTGLVLLTGMVLRSCHHFADVPWDAAALFESRLTQAALSVTWALCGVLTMVLGHRRAARSVWIAGAVLLGAVVLKLFFVELADQGGLFRIVSFLSVGVLLLLVGYFAPVPPAVAPKHPAPHEDPSEDASKNSGKDTA